MYMKTNDLSSFFSGLVLPSTATKVKRLSLIGPGMTIHRIIFVNWMVSVLQLFFGLSPSK